MNSLIANKLDGVSLTQKIGTISQKADGTWLLLLRNFRRNRSLCRLWSQFLHAHEDINLKWSVFYFINFHICYCRTESKTVLEFSRKELFKTVSIWPSFIHFLVPCSSFRFTAIFVACFCQKLALSKWFIWNRLRGLLSACIIQHV